MCEGFSTSEGEVWVPVREGSGNQRVMVWVLVVRCWVPVSTSIYLDVLHVPSRMKINSRDDVYWFLTEACQGSILVCTV